MVGWGVYELIRHSQIEEESATIQVCHFILKQQVPLKVQIFGWLLFNGLVMQAFQKIMFPKALAKSIMCTRREDIVFTCSLSAHLPGQYKPAKRTHEWISHQQRLSEDLAQESCIGER